MSSQQTSKNSSINSQQYQTINQSLLHNREEKEFPLEEINANKVENVAEKAQIEYQKKITKKLESQLLQTTDLSSSVFSVANTIMGTGCLALSFTISQWGPIIGSSLMIFFFFINVYTSELCIKASRLTGLVSFSSIAKKAFGRGGSLLVKLAIIVTNFGATLIYASNFLFSYTIYWMA